MTIRTFIDRRQLRDGVRNADLDHNFAHTPVNDFDGLLAKEFYIIGDSLTSPSGGGIIKFDITTDGAGNVTAIANTTTDTGWERDFTLVHRDGGYAWFAVTVNLSTGAISGMTLTTQVGALTFNLTAQANTQDASVSSWAYNIWNNYALNGEIDATPGTSYDIAGTQYVYQGINPTSDSQICLVTLGGNDAGQIEIDVGGGLTATGAASTITEASLQTACEALYTTLLAKGYLVIIQEAAYNGLLPTAGWTKATDAVNRAINAAAVVKGIEAGTCMRMGEVLRDVLDPVHHPA